MDCLECILKECNYLRNRLLRELPDGVVVELHAFTTEGPGSVPRWGTKISQAVWCCQKIKQTKPIAQI